LALGLLETPMKSMPGMKLSCCSRREKHDKNMQVLAVRECILKEIAKEILVTY